MSRAPLPPPAGAGDPLPAPETTVRDGSLELHGLTVARDGRTLLEQAELKLPAGVRASVQGRSGSGKTTLLRIIAGLEVPDAGEVRLGGCPATVGTRLQLAPWERGVQMVFQDLGLWPTRTVLQNVTDALKASGHDQPRARAMSTLEALDVAGLAERRVGALSGGEARRLAFARALALEPRILLLDEPFTSLDPESRQQGFELLEQVLESTAATVLLVTHDPEEAERLGGRALRLQRGLLA